MLSILPEPTLCEQLGYFALVCKLRIYVSLGDYYQAIRILDMIPNKALDVFRKNAAFSTPIEEQIIDHGNDVIADFEDGIDKISILSGVASNFAGLTINNSGANAVIQLSSVSSITVMNMAGQLDDSDFNFI